ncbi:MAG: hypothetical protein CMC82_06030, partial [Flavobacteriaceae bacterium]|nr:hypothetical protein [Flavobacteriaceae bacterium]
MPTQSIDLGNTEDVLFNDFVVDKVTLGTASTAANTHQIIWERANYAISGAATYSPYTKKVTYAVTLAHVTSWTYEAVRQGDNATTGVQGPYTQASVDSGVLGTPQDGTWDVTFKGYTGTTHRVTATTTVTVATPTIEITSISLESGGSSTGLPIAYTAAQQACDPTANLDGYLYDENHYVIRYAAVQPSGSFTARGQVYEFYCYGSASSFVT